MNRAERRAEKRKAGHKPRKLDFQAPMKVLLRSRPYEADEITPDIVECWVAYDHLCMGEGDKRDYDLVSMTLNAISIRCEEISPELWETVALGQRAMARMKAGFAAGRGLVVDAAGVIELNDALEVFEAVVQESSRLQMTLAVREAYRRIREGNLIEVAA